MEYYLYRHRNIDYTIKASILCVKTLRDGNYVFFILRFTEYLPCYKWDMGFG